MHKFEEEVIDLLKRLNLQMERLERLETSSKTNKNKLYNSKKAAEWLGVTERSLYTYRQNGLKFSQIGKKIIYSESHLNEFLNEHLVNNQNS